MGELNMRTSREAVRLRLAATAWAEYVNTPPADEDDTEGKRRWRALSKAALAYARKAAPRG